MSTSTETRGTGGGLLALSGIAFVVLAIVGIIVLGGDTPDDEASAEKIASFYQAHQHRQFAAAFVLAASAPFPAIFGAALALAVWPLQSAGRRIWPILLAGGALRAPPSWHSPSEASVGRRGERYSPADQSCGS
jgi:ABC-type Fe3+ transport system permease subunit